MKKKMLFMLPLLAMLFILAKCEEEDEGMIDLPQNIRNYLNTNYPGAEIEESGYDTLCTGQAVIEVEIEVSDDNELDLAFDSEGNLLFTEKEIKVADLPQAVSSGVGTQYAGYLIAEAEMASMADGSTRYEVEIKSEQKVLEVLLQADGTVICEKEGDDD